MNIRNKQEYEAYVAIVDTEDSFPEYEEYLEMTRKRDQIMNLIEREKRLQQAK